MDKARIFPGIAPHKAQHIARNLRRIDLLEAEYAGHDPEMGLYDSIMMSDLDLMWTIQLEGIPIGCFGCGRSPAGSWGIPWLLGTYGMSLVHRQFLKESRYYVEKMNERYPILTNWVWIENEPSVRWLTWCGFEIVDAQDINKHLFLMMQKKR